MPEYPIPHLAQKFMELFESNPEAYGLTRLTGAIREDGKHEAKSWLHKQPVTQGVWEKHLSGTEAMGLIPIKNNNCVRWAAMDIDTYDGRLRIEDIQQKIAEYDLPFILCRSKSGGAHIYVFFSEDAPADRVIQQLKIFSGYFGQGTSEIFPKQERIGTRTDDSRYGNWINMPYDGPESLRYALDHELKAFSPSAFVDHGLHRRINPAKFFDLQPPNLPTEVFPEGPPCLNTIFANLKQGDPSGRNTTLFNVATYLKKATPDAWKGELMRINKMFNQPLSDQEVNNTIVKSHEKKDYEHYQCGKQPICSHCNSSLCRKRTYGISGDGFDPDNRSLMKVMTEPPLWYLTIEGREVKLTTVEFDSFHLFNMRIMEVLDKQYTPMPAKDWLELKNRLLKNRTIVEIPHEMTPVGQLKEYIGVFAVGAVAEPDGMLQGNPYKDRAGNLYFRMRDLKEFLRGERFKELPPNEVLAVIKQKMKGEQVSLRPDNKHIRCWRIPADSYEIPADPTLPSLEQPEI